MTMWQWRQGLEWCFYKIRNAKDCQQTAETRRVKEVFFPTGFRGSVALLTPWFWTSSLQNWETINLCCFKSFSLWQLITAAPGNKHTPLLTSSSAHQATGFLLQLQGHTLWPPSPIPPTSQALETTKLLFPWVWIFLVCTYKWNHTIFVFLSLWLISLSTMSSSSIYMGANGRISFFLVAE